MEGKELVAIIPTVKYTIYENKNSIWEYIDQCKVIDKQQQWKIFQQRKNRLTLPIIQEQYKRQGFCIFKDLFSQESLRKSKKSVNKIFQKLIACYDNIADEFTDFDQVENAITRMPRIGRGKHNIHFDPEFSEQHEVLSQMIAEAGVLDLLSTVSSGKCTLRESGMSLTRPNITLFGNASPGEGMEWHSDGAKGEFTMLLGLDDVEEIVGSLRIVPKSHLEYVEGIGHDEVTTVLISIFKL